jgi:hypothetical protein
MIQHPFRIPVPAMLTPKQVIDAYFLEARHQLLEVAALLDRYDAAAARAGGPGRPDGDPRLAALREALAVLADRAPAGERTVTLLELFAKT